MIMTRIGNWLKEQRQRAGLTQDAAAQMAGISRQTIIRTEKGGSPTEWETVQKLAAVYGASLDEAGSIFTEIKEPDLDLRLAQKLEPHLMKLPPEKRRHAENALEEMARAFVSV
jgi:DNA-binding XRE family transcriptional regulator